METQQLKLIVDYNKFNRRFLYQFMILMCFMIREMETNLEHVLDVELNIEEKWN